MSPIFNHALIMCYLIVPYIIVVHLVMLNLIMTYLNMVYLIVPYLLISVNYTFSWCPMFGKLSPLKLFPMFALFDNASIICYLIVPYLILHYIWLCLSNDDLFHYALSIYVLYLAYLITVCLIIVELTLLYLIMVYIWHIDGIFNYV